MDSWTDSQLALMKTGGNDKCNDYLKAHGIAWNTPIKQKYESDAAQLYKEVLKARVEGRPEPTKLSAVVKQHPSSAPPSLNGPPLGRPGGPVGGGDPNGMERLAGETDQQYIARQTRLREEARARMQAKFGGGGGLGGVGSGGASRMQGIGSNPGYNPNGGYGGDLGIDSLTNAFGSVFSTVGSVAGSVTSSVTSLVNDPQTKASVSNLGSTVTNVGGSFWNSLASTVTTVAGSITQPDEDDGLAELQRQIQSNRPQQSKYGGFGSDSMQSGQATNSWNMPNNAPMGGVSMGGSGLGEAPGLPGEDRNGIARLTGESDEQYIARQTRLRDEAKARMAAKFGGGGLGSASSSSYQPTPVSASNFASPNGMNLNTQTKQAPVSGTYPTSMTPPRKNSNDSFTAPRKNSKDDFNSDDFFASFGT